MKKTILLSLCCIGTILFAACGQTTTESDEKIQTKETERITESTANTEIDTGLTTEVPESVINLYEQSIAEASHQNVLKIIVDTFENDDKYYAFALTGPDSVLPYTGDRYEYYEDTHVWFMSENGETSYSESDVEIVDGKIEFANSEQIVHN